MKEDELKRYKEALLQYLKHQNFLIYDPIFDRIQKPVMNITGINDKVNTSLAREKFEKETEEFVKLLVFKSIEFDEIEITIRNNVFVSEYYYNKLENSQSTQERKNIKKSLCEKDLLHEITSAQILFTAKKDGQKIYTSNYEDLGYIKYDEFTKQVESLGYEISPKTFDELATRIITKIYPEYNKSTININFNPKKHKRL